ncbi:potassium channel family protein [Sediminitomix flava]|uniref:Trk system potassium uptake protein TrkA n=1 Tax=Sediminitomix flava TaxID=379075 RepID=A0A315Z865_SEDFL|nr:TrkA family potassium uptake protein [Sediminitomix flava]PWJ39226.1 trk system potassium uptake protein TrkA [Sediminitomix flava]
MTQKFAVIGLGQFGSAVARKLSHEGAEVLAIDKNIDRIEIIKDEVAFAVALDSTDGKALKAQSVQDMDAVLVAIGENIEGLLLTVVQLLELNIKRIIARVVSPQQKIILDKLGVSEVISPEDAMGEAIAETLLNPHMHSFLSLPDNHQIADVSLPIRLIQKTVGELDFEENYNLELLAIKRTYETTKDGHRYRQQHLIKKIRSDIELEAQDELVIFGLDEDIETFLKVNS